MLFELPPSKRSRARGPSRRLPMVDAEQYRLAFAREPEEDELDELVHYGVCPVDPYTSPCPMVSCRHHLFSLGENDRGKGSSELADEVLALPCTCMHVWLSRHPHGASVREVAAALRLAEQSLREEERRATDSPVFDAIVAEVSDAAGCDEPTGADRAALVCMMLERE